MARLDKARAEMYNTRKKVKMLLHLQMPPTRKLKEKKPKNQKKRK